MSNDQARDFGVTGVDFLNRVGLNVSLVPGGTSREELLEMLKHSDWRYRTNAARVLGMAAGISEDTGLLYAQFSKDENVHVKGCCAQAIGCLSQRLGTWSILLGEEIVGALTEFLDGLDDSIAKVEVIEALGLLAECGLEIPDKGIELIRAAVLDDSSIDVIKMAGLVSLGAMGKRCPINAILALTDDRFEDIRKIALEQLSRLAEVIRADEALWKRVSRVLAAIQIRDGSGVIRSIASDVANEIGVNIQ